VSAPLPPAPIAPLVERLHHVAIAVESIAQARGGLERSLGLRALEVEHVPDQKVNVLVLYGGTQRLELVEPAAPDSPVSRFLERRGGGLHHIAWSVRDLDAALERLRSLGVRLIDTAARPGSHGTRIAFLHPTATGGVLTELVEDPHEKS
jgi:methylmalonyl-CoA/ethylmalonyl-CoA epimerase